MKRSISVLSKKLRPHSKYEPHQGEQEKARRRKQMDRLLQKPNNPTN